MVQDPVQLGRVTSVKPWRDLGDQAGAGEHLAPRQEPTVDAEDVGGERLDLTSRQWKRQPARLLLGRGHVGGEPLDRPAGGLRLGPPSGQELVDTGVPFQCPAGAGGDPASAVAGVTGGSGVAEPKRA